MRYLAVILYLFLAFSSKAQVYTRYVVENGDTVPVVDLPVCYVGDFSKPPEFKSKKEAKKYNRLTRYVKKVYPYATLAASKLNEYKEELDTLKSKRRKRQIMKEVEKSLIKEYGDEMKNLTIMQGQILLKLIDRQTGRTTYNLVKELRGGVSAGMWQGVALLFGGNLKLTYDPEGKDWMIEDIVRRIEMGYI